MVLSSPASILSIRCRLSNDLGVPSTASAEVKADRVSRKEFEIFSPTLFSTSAAIKIVLLLASWHKQEDNCSGDKFDNSKLRLFLKNRVAI